MHVVLLRGLAREQGHWLDFPACLRAHLGADCQIHTIDFPGCGAYHQMPALDSIAAMTEHARAVLAQQHAQLAKSPAQAPVYLLGISMGGMVALDWVQRFPQEVEGVVLINSSSGNQPFWWRLRPRAWLSLLLALLLPPAQREALVLQQVSNRRIDYQQHLQQWLAIQQRHPISRATIMTMLRAAAAFIPRMSYFPQGLVLASRQDRLVSQRASAALAQRFNWPIAVHPSAGHDLPLDDGDWVAQQIAAWQKHLG